MAIVYTVYKMSESAEIASEGFDIRNVSTDGLLVVVDKNSEVEPTVTSESVVINENGALDRSTELKLWVKERPLRMNIFLGKVTYY